MSARRHPGRVAGLVLVAALLAAAALAPATASGHAVLRDTEPARGAVAPEAPATVVLRFSEPVEGSFGAVRVFDRTGSRVDTGSVLRPGGGNERVGIRLREGLPDGTYTATFRVISADSHPVSGGFVFSIGSAGAAPAKTVEDLIDEGNAGPVTEVAFGAARWLDYAAIAMAIGILALLLGVWVPALRAAGGAAGTWRSASEAFGRRLGRLALGTVLAGVAATALGIVLQGATAAGVSFWSALDPAVVGDVLETRFGTVWGLRLVAWALLALALAVPALRTAMPVLRPAQLGATGLVATGSRRWPLAPVLAAVAFLAVSPALAGHASTQSPEALLVPLDALHVSAMGAWLGGLVVLVAVLPAATRLLEPADRTRLLAGVLERFSALALAAVVALVASGLVQSYVHVRSVENLVETAFGRAVLIKMVLMVGLVALGWLNRQRHLPRLRAAAAGGESPGEAGRVLRRTLRAEVALIAVVLAVTAALVSYAPAISEGSGPFTATERLGPARLEMTVDPARVGRNEMHLYLLNPRTGAQYTGVKQLRVLVRLPSKRIGPLRLPAREAGPGHYVVEAGVLGVAGEWEVELIGRVSEFDEYRTKVEVPID